MTPFDNKNGLVKTYWHEVRQKVMLVEPTFARHVDQLAPDKNFPLYLAYYPYGALASDAKSSVFPRADGSLYRLSDAVAPKDVCAQLGYSKENTPLAMVLEKQLELYIDLEAEKMTIPWFIYAPGMFFPFSSILKMQHQRTYAPHGILTLTAGVRSVFMLPFIGRSVNHSNLQRDFNIKSPTPKCLYQQWPIFKELASTLAPDEAWRSAVLYFSENWIKSLHHDASWMPLKQYLHELAWKHYQYEINRICYDMTFSLIQKKRNLKPNPYLVDTAKHLFATALGAAPGFAPILDSEALPLDYLQKAYTDSYQLKKYYPTIMGPRHYHFEEDSLPIYYSLQHPSTQIFSPKSRKLVTTLFDLRELEYIMRIFIEELTKKNSPCNDTIMGQIATQVELQYFHSKEDSYKIVQKTVELAKKDYRFTSLRKKHKNQEATFSSDATFLRGCISIHKKASGGDKGL